MLIVRILENNKVKVEQVYNNNIYNSCLSRKLDTLNLNNKFINKKTLQ